LSSACETTSVNRSPVQDSAPEAASALGVGHFLGIRTISDRGRHSRRGREAGAAGNDVVIGRRAVLQGRAQFEPRKTRAVRAGGLFAIRGAGRQRAKGESGAGGRRLSSSSVALCGGSADRRYPEPESDSKTSGSSDNEPHNPPDKPQAHAPLIAPAGCRR
jgi:hypothetical protein